MQHGDVGRDALEIGEDVGREQHRGSEFAGAQDDFPQQFPAPDWIESRGRLVEDQQLGRMRH